MLNQIWIKYKLKVVWFNFLEIEIWSFLFYIYIYKRFHGKKITAKNYDSNYLVYDLQS